MKNIILILGLLAITIESYAFESFEVEAQKATKSLGCSTPKIIGKSAGSGRLYMCLGGVEQTVKYFINEEDNSTSVRSVKFLWVDYTKDIGSGLHTDAALAEAWAASLGKMFAPTKLDAVIKAFASKSDIVINGGSHKLAYTYHAGPAAAQRMFIVTRKTN